MNIYIRIMVFTAIGTVLVNASDWDREFYEVHIAPQARALKAKQRARKEALQKTKEYPERYKNFEKDIQEYNYVHKRFPVAKQEEIAAGDMAQKEERENAKKWDFRSEVAKKKHAEKLDEVINLINKRDDLAHRFRWYYPYEWQKYAEKHKESLEGIEPLDVTLQRKIQKNQWRSVFSKWTKSFYDYWYRK